VAARPELPGPGDLFGSHDRSLRDDGNARFDLAVMEVYPEAASAPATGHEVRNPPFSQHPVQGSQLA
jgi:hypothetical protein